MGRANREPMAKICLLRLSRSEAIFSAPLLKSADAQADGMNAGLDDGGGAQTPIEELSRVTEDA